MGVSRKLLNLCLIKAGTRRAMLGAYNCADAVLATKQLPVTPERITAVELEDPLAGRLGLAVRAGTRDAELAHRPDVLVAAFVPDESHLALSEADDFERHGHGARIVPRCPVVNVVRCRCPRPRAEFTVMG